MKKLFVMALCLGLGLASTSCKKEEVKPEPTPAVPVTPPTGGGGGGTGGGQTDPTTFDPEYAGTGKWSLAALGATLTFSNDGTVVLNFGGQDTAGTYSINSTRTKVTASIGQLINVTDQDLNWSDNNTMSFDSGNPIAGEVTITRVQ